MSFIDDLIADAAVFINSDEFAEELLYTPFNDSAVTIYGIVDRQPANRMSELTSNPTDYMVVAIRNHPTLGRTSIAKQKDTITVAATYDGTERVHLVTDIISGDAGIWLLKVR